MSKIQRKRMTLLPPTASRLSKAITIFLIGLPSLLPAAAPTPPNVIVILADDLGYGIVNSYGGDPKRVTTPNIDRLAAEGAKFTEGYVTCSVCGPSRAGLMTGRYQQRFGIYANCDNQAKNSGVPGDQTLMSRYFKDAGYATAMIGKWHLGTKKPGQHPLERGFDEYYGFDSAQTDFFESPILFDGRTKVEQHDYLTREFTDRAIRFMEKSGDTPFFVYLAYNAVHGPNQAPKETTARFSGFPKHELVEAAMVAELDSGIGRVLDALDKSGKAKDTLIFFLSDNGGLPYWWKGSNGNLRGLKRFQFDGGNKVPFIVRWPAAVAADQVRTQPVISLDILPTALAAAGIPTPENEVLDGIDLLPSLKAQQDLQPDRPLFWAGSHFECTDIKSDCWENHDNPPPAWAVRKGKWKLIQIMEHGRPMLFNIANDPSESNDLIAQNPEVASEMQRAFAKWFQIGADPIAWNRVYFQQLKAIR
ncbi:sulfatase-like hydrolase/transferase [Aporhodopirellula aestuarii]|uniref:Sulfatase-like hydrolase/transferase n=1 Tax=Aporhodopirellula aestuarii TaxID=2950107 RepID=A0ABT0U3L9_9BACT|nr:sulfatase-like hydrolase/transferase [Aporhodopirellula aestuarii]MCM2371512.1 sulfatase-like hydrolase/transferase [Aporhodopirellula aestuarii]